MENCQCSGSPRRPLCSPIETRGLVFKKHEDLEELVFARSSACKLFSFDSPETTATTLSSLDKFTLFSQLPSELRLEVWKFALSVPRLIVLSPTDVDNQETPHLFIDAPPPPACLPVCQESRAEALKLYSTHLLTAHSYSPTYLNFSTDTFLLGGPAPNIDLDYMMYILLPHHPDSHRVQHLHISRGCFRLIADWTHLRSRFSGLKDLTISFPTGDTLRPYIHGCWNGRLSREKKEAVVREELFRDGEDGKSRWEAYFDLNIVHYNSPPMRPDSP